MLKKKYGKSFNYPPKSTQIILVQQKWKIKPKGLIFSKFCVTFDTQQQPIPVQFAIRNIPKHPLVHHLVLPQ